MGTTSSQYGPYAQGRTRATMAGTEGADAARRRKPPRAGPSSDRGLQPDPVKSDLLVTAHQLRRRECLHPKSGVCRPKVWVVIGMKS